MNKVKAFYNKNFKFLMLLFSINPIVNIVLDNKKKEVLQSNFSQFGFILTIVISLVFIYYHNNLERVKRINTEKTSFVVFTIFSLICSILKFTFIETLIISFQGTFVFFVLMKVFINKIENKINRIKIVESKDIYKEEEKLYDSRVPSKDRILEILKGDIKSLILVDGEWGIGKTFFMDKVLDEGKNILAVKVDVLLFNEKKQMINFVMDEIHKILLDKGIRSTSIRKYLSVINDGIDNKFIKGLYKVFSNEKTDDIEKNIKEDIEALKDEKLVVIVDNLERTLDKKITIDILGFLHYIYEKLGINVVVLADSSKLRDEISREIPSAEDYLKKFFIDKIKLPSVDYREIINKLEIIDLFLRNTDIQDNIIYEYQKNEKDLSSSINGNKLSIRITENKKELKEKNTKERQELKQNRSKLDIYNSDYYKILRVFENPRSYQSIQNLYEDCKERVKTTYEIKDEKLKEYENILLRIAFYKEIYGNEKFNGDTLKDERPLTYKLLFDNAKSDLDKSIINVLINYSNDEIVDVIKIIENSSVPSKDIKESLQHFEIYYTAFGSYIDRIKKLYEFYETKKDEFFEYLNNPENMKYLFGSRLKYDGLVYIDRMYYLENNNSILTKLYNENQFLKSRGDNNENDINGSVLKLTKRLLSNIYNRTIDDYPDEFDYNFRNIVSHNSGKMVDLVDVDIDKTIRDIKEKLNNSNLFNLEKKYVEYFLVCFENYFGKIKPNINYQNSKINEFLNTLEEIIKLKNKINILGTSVEEQFSFKKHKFELDNLESKRLEIRKKLHTNHGYSINTSEELQNKIDISKRIFELSNDIEDVIDYQFSISNSGTVEFSKLYGEFLNNKKIERDDDFERIFAKKGINFKFSEDLIKEEENHDL